MYKGFVQRKMIAKVELEELRQALQELRSEFLEDVEKKLQKRIDRIFSELELKKKRHQNGFKEKPSPVKECRSPKELPAKEFVLRNSALENLWKNHHLRSLYNCVLSIFVLLHFYIAVFYYLNVERFKKDLDVIFYAISQVHIAIATWLGINLSIVFVLYPVYRFWATNRVLAKKKGFYDSLFCILFVSYEAALYIIPATIIITYNLPPASSFLVLVEQSRLFMKSYAFVRENIPRALKYKPHQDGDKEDSDSCPCPKLEKLVYFLFAPTLVYRDNYPRTTHIRWSYVAWSYLQMLYCVFGYYLAFIWFGVNTFNKAGAEPIPFCDFIGALAQSIFAGSIIMITSFYSTLHSVQEVFGEILRFGDRRFYDDWWNSTSFAQFYRSWNILVHDWLYSYIYRDMYVVFGKKRTGAMLSVFIISAVVHEYILALICKFLFPLLFILFMTFGVLLVFITRNKTSSFWNGFIWFSMFQGCGLLHVFYTLEWYARINCPRTLDSWQDYFVPRSLYCKMISWPSW